MDRVVLSGQQQAAIAAILYWYRYERHHQQVARVWGYAGTGKSTITRYVIEELGLEPVNRQAGTGGVSRIGHAAPPAVVPAATAAKNASSRPPGRPATRASRLPAATTRPA